MSQPNAVSADVTTGLVGHWNLDEGSGTTAADSSGNSINGTISGPTWTTGIKSSALQFNGSGSVGSASNNVNLGNSASLNNIGNHTLSMWVKFDSGYVGNGGTWANLVGRTSGANFAYMVYINSNGRLRVHLQESSGTLRLYDSAATMPVGEWIHIVQVADGSSLRMYINGVEDTNSPIAYNGTGRNLPAANTYIGQDTRESTFKGAIDDVRIYNRGLTISDVRELISAPGGVLTGLKTWQKADAGTSSTTNNTAISAWNDQSGNNVHTTQATGTNQPTFRNNATDNFNFNPVIGFDGSNDYLANATGINHTVTTNGEDIFAVAHPNSLPSGYGAIFALGTNASSRNITYLRFGLNQFHYLARNNSVSWQLIANPTTTANQTQLVNASRNTTGNASAIWNGSQVATGTLNQFATHDYLSIGIYREIGTYGFPFNGRIGETIFYNKQLSTDERERVASYLALKYGLTLGHDYVDSANSTFWDRTAISMYSNDIAGIGRDDLSGLNQKQSASSNSTSIVAIGNNTLAISNSANSNNFSADNTFMAWGHNNGAVNAWSSSGAPTNYSKLARIWHVEETNSVGNTTVSFNVENANANIPNAITNYYLLMDADNDNVLTDETPIQLYDDGTHGDPTAGDNQFSVNSINFDDGEEFTLSTFSATYEVEVIPDDNLTSEDGDTGSFKVQLGARPSAAVTVALSSSNTDEGTVPSSITIQPADWNNPDANVVTVTGIDDTPAVGDGAVGYSIVTGDVTSADANFDALDGADVNDVSMSNQNNDPPGITVTVENDDTTTDEDGATVTLQFELLSQPTGGHSVTIPLSLSDTTEGTLNGVTSITIANANWNNPSANEVTITGANDALVDGDVLYQVITGDPTSSDPGYDALGVNDIADPTLTNSDNDTPGITISQSSGATNVTEGGATDTVSVVLDSRPAPGNVVVIDAIPSAQLNLGSGAGTTIQLTFDENNWDQTQIVTVSAQDDSVYEGNHTALISFSVNETDTTETDYISLNTEDVTATITDNDIAPSDDTGDTSTDNNATNNNDNTSASRSTCSDLAPGGSPDLFQINVIDTHGVLYFAPVLGADSYFITYGEGDRTDKHAVHFKSGISTGVLSYTINDLLPNTTYSIKVSAGKGCASGGWSNTMQVNTRTDSKKTAIFYKNFLARAFSVLPRQVTNAGSGGAQKPKVQPKQSAKNACEYKVKPGDSLWNISIKHYGAGKNYKDIMQKNKLPSTQLKTGQVLKLDC